MSSNQRPDCPLDDVRVVTSIYDTDPDAFWRRVFEVVNDYAQLPRSDEVEAYAFLAARYPRLPETAADDDQATSKDVRARPIQ